MTRLLVLARLALAAPAFVPIVLGLLSVGGGVFAGLMSWTDWQTAGLFIVCFLLVGALLLVDSKWSRLGIVMVMGACLYAKGRIDENVSHEGELTRITLAHEGEIRKIRDGFAAATKAEQARQEQIAQAMVAKATMAKIEFDESVGALRAELAKIKQESRDAADADDLVFDADDIAALNRLRFDPRKRRPKARTRPRSGKAKNRQAAFMGSPSLPAVAGYSSRQAEKGRGERLLGFRFQAVRAVPAETASATQACGGAGCGINWWRGF